MQVLMSDIGVWSFVKEFTGRSGLHVSISRRMDPKPQWSIRLGRHARDGDQGMRVRTFVPVFGELGEKGLSASREVIDLVEQAVAWIDSDMKAMGARNDS
jgi:hypothetical protein